MTKELFYFSLPAPDLERSKIFFHKVLGWEVAGGSLGGNVHNTTTPCGLSPGTTDTNETSIYLTTFDLDESIDQVKTNGGTVARVEEFSVGRCAFCCDDQGTHFALQEPSEELRPHAEKPPKGKKNGDLFYFSMPVADEGKAKKFFSKVMGWEFGEKGSQGGMCVTNLAGPDGGLGCGREGHRPALYFRVDNLQTTCEVIKSSGGSVGEIFNGPEGTSCECFDDQGVKFGLSQPSL